MFNIDCLKYIMIERINIYVVLARDTQSTVTKTRVISNLNCVVNMHLVYSNCLGKRINETLFMQTRP